MASWLVWIANWRNGNGRVCLVAGSLTCCCLIGDTNPQAALFLEARAPRNTTNLKKFSIHFDLLYCLYKESSMTTSGSMSGKEKGGQKKIRIA